MSTWRTSRARSGASVAIPARMRLRGPTLSISAAVIWSDVFVASSGTLLVGAGGSTSGDGMLESFSRDPSTGALTAIGCAEEGGSLFCANAEGIGGANEVAVAPSGPGVYVAAEYGGPDGPDGGSTPDGSIAVLTVGGSPGNFKQLECIAAIKAASGDLQRSVERRTGPPRALVRRRLPRRPQRLLRRLRWPGRLQPRSRHRKTGQRSGVHAAERQRPVLLERGATADRRAACDLARRRVPLRRRRQLVHRPRPQPGERDPLRGRMHEIRVLGRFLPGGARVRRRHRDRDVSRRLHPLCGGREARARASCVPSASTRRPANSPTWRV